MPDTPNSDAPQAVISALLASGFPFQTAVSQVVRQTPRCTLAGEEIAWRDDTGTDQFLDLVARKGHVSFPIECKKTQKETLTFLLPDVADCNVNRTRCVYLSQIQDSTRRMELFCGDWILKPKSAESAFCVVSTSDSGKDQRLLERDIQRLVRGTDAYVRRYQRDLKPLYPELDSLFIPLLVTNAKLFVASYDASYVSLDTGQFAMPLQATVSSTPWVRLRKAFTSENKDIGDRTVFIVAATELQELLTTFDTIGAPSEKDRIHI